MLKWKAKRKPKRANFCENLELERVIGVTTKTGCGLASNVSTGDFAYIAGCVVVIHNADTNKQGRFLVASRTPKPLTCVAYSNNGGKFIVAGESGDEAAALVWDSMTGACMADLKAHRYGISSVAFSPNGRHLVSVGFPHDGFLCVWEWRARLLLAKNKVAIAHTSIMSLQFSSDGNSFLTAGTKHFKHWTIGSHANRRTTAGIGTLAIEGKPVYLGSHKDNTFVAVSSAPQVRTPTDTTLGHVPESLQPIYALTNTGILCLLQSTPAIKYSFNLKVKKGYGLAVSESLIACACSDSVVHLFKQELPLHHAATLPMPMASGSSHEKLKTGPQSENVVTDFCFPDAIACSFSASCKLAVIYRDHSLHIWDVHDIFKITRTYSFFTHSASIWDICILPPSKRLLAVTVGTSREGAFATCSADGTVRLWDMTLENDSGLTQKKLQHSQSNPVGIHCRDMLHVDYSDRRGEINQRKANAQDPIDLCKGFHSLAVSKDGEYLAAGDRNGNLYVYCLANMNLQCLQKAHDGEILSLSFSNEPVKENNVDGQTSPHLLASGGRDQLIHVYDVDRGFDIVETLHEHSSSITRVKFACGAAKLLSCGVDKSVNIYNIEATESGFKGTQYHQEVEYQGTIKDLDVNDFENLVVAVGQDKRLNFIRLSTGKSIRSFKPNGEAGEPHKVCVDQSGTYLLCSHSDKCMRIYDFRTGDVLAHAYGHAEIITGMAFLPDSKHAISVGGDSCIFVWKLPIHLSEEMQKKCYVHSKVDTPAISTFGRQHIAYITDNIQGEASSVDFHNLYGVSATPLNLTCPRPSIFKFTVSRLPKWAQTKVMPSNHGFVKADSGKVESKAFQPSESRWIERSLDGHELLAEFRKRKMLHSPIYSVDYSFHERSTDIQNDDSNCSESEQGSIQHDTHGQTVRTVFFNRPESSQGDCEEAYQNFCRALLSNHSASIYNNKREPLPLMDKTIRCLGESNEPCYPEKFNIVKNGSNRQIGSGDESDYELIDNKDLFTVHHGTSSRATKLPLSPTSGRNSSTGFLAHANSSIEKTTFFEISPTAKSGVLAKTCDNMHEPNTSVDSSSPVATRIKGLMNDLEKQPTIGQKHSSANLDYALKEKRAGCSSLKQVSISVDSLACSPEWELDQDCLSSNHGGILPAKVCNGGNKSLGTNSMTEAKEIENLNLCLEDCQNFQAKMIDSSSSSTTDSITKGSSLINRNDTATQQPNSSGNKADAVPHQGLSSMEVCEQAMKNLLEAADTALKLFTSLLSDENSHEEINGIKSKLESSDFIQQTVVSTLERVQKLSDLVIPSRSRELQQVMSDTSRNMNDGGRLGCNNNDLRRLRLMQSTSPVCLPANPPNSVDIQPFVESYSKLLSEQVIALVRKGLMIPNE